MDEDIFIFSGPSWIMKIHKNFFLFKSQARCRAVIKNAFIDRYRNDAELLTLADWMSSMIYKLEEQKADPKTQQKFRNLITYILLGDKKHG